MNLSPESLRELREHFRLKFREHDFCIGEEQVERVFRELLGEPEIERELPIDLGAPKPRITTEMLSSVMSDMFMESATKLFDQDNGLYTKLKR